MNYSIIQIVSFETGLKYIPSYISKESIDEICPYMTKHGKPYKNVSIIERLGKTQTIVGNYKEHRKATQSNEVQGIGYRK